MNKGSPESLKHCLESRNYVFVFRRIQPEDLSLIADCKNDVKAFKANRRTGEKSAESDDLSTPSPHTAPAEHRRERKSKFSVKDIFNYRKQGGGVVTSLDVSRGTPPPPKLISEGGGVLIAPSVGSQLAVGKKCRRLPSNLKPDSSEVKSDSEENRSDCESVSSSMIEVSDGPRLVESPVVVAHICPRGGDGLPSICLQDGLQTRRGKPRPVSLAGRRTSSRSKEEGDRNGNSPPVGTRYRTLPAVPPHLLDCPDCSVADLDKMVWI